MTIEERDELAWLRAENALLRTERDMLLRIATGYAEDAAEDACRTSTEAVSAFHAHVPAPGGADRRARGADTAGRQGTIEST